MQVFQTISFYMEVRNGATVKKVESKTRMSLGGRRENGAHCSAIGDEPIRKEGERTCS